MNILMARNLLHSPNPDPELTHKAKPIDFSESNPGTTMVNRGTPWHFRA